MGALSRSTQKVTGFNPPSAHAILSPHGPDRNWSDRGSSPKQIYYVTLKMSKYTAGIALPNR